MELRAGYKRTEVGVIPEDWEVRAVREMGEVVTGKALAVHAPGKQRPYLRTKNVFDGRIDIGDVLTMPMTDEQFEQFRVRPGDVLLNEGQSLELVGRCAVYGNEYPDPCAIQNQLVRYRALAGVSSDFSGHLFRHCQHTGVFARIALQTTSIAHLGGTRFGQLRLAWPPEPEQHAIAEALGDVDALLRSLDQLIAKRRDIKQAAMQQLLTGRQRLPGFAEEWQSGPLGSLLVICHGKNQRAVEQPDGPYPILASGGQIGAASHALFEGPSVLIGRKGTINQPRYMDSPFWTVDTLFYSVMRGGNCAKYLYYQFQLIDWMQHNEASGVPSLSARTIEGIRVSYPEPPEQRAIAEVLSDLDAELTALEARRDKTQALKHGMMQALLTGRIRLV
jgi:type I restriction enzyme S subunit